MATSLFYSNLLTPTESIPSGALVISDEGKIAYAGPMEDAPQAEGKRLDLRGLFLVPGFIDIHVHGGKGITFGESGRAEDELGGYSEWVAGNGVTGFLASLAAPDQRALVDLVGRYVRVMQQGLPGAEALGIHLEGPFISKEKKGAFNPQWLRPPSMEEAEAVLKAGQGWIRQITIAPELPGAGEVASRFRREGVVVAFGHTNSDYATASAALTGTFTHVTHTYNAQRGFQQREPGAFGAILASEQVTAEVIADGIHSHPAAIKILLRCLGSDRVALITDAMAGAGLPDGNYHLIGQPVTVKEGKATLADGTIAGSTVLLNECVRNVHEWLGVSLAEAAKMASLVPARAMGLGARYGSLRPGREASLAAIDAQARVRLTTVRGKVVYSNL
jgi:N-acetylglucosamine-6-phosphate deacetylase